MKKLFSFFTLISALGSIYNTGLITETSKKLREFKALELAESSGRIRAYNEKKRAIGKFQIRYPAKKEFNDDTGKNYKMRDMYDPNLASHVAGYYLEKSERYFRAYYGTPLFKILKYNSYNMGRNGSISIINGQTVFKIYMPYIEKILLPAEIAEFNRKYVWIKQRGDIYYYVPIKRLLNDRKTKG